MCYYFLIKKISVGVRENIIKYNRFIDGMKKHKKNEKPLNSVGTATAKLISFVRRFFRE